jgi:hypothetical protein
MKEFKLAPTNKSAPPGESAPAEGVPVVVAYLQPFCLLLNEIDEWVCSLDNVNHQTFDYVKLNKITGGVDIGLKSSLSLLLGFDGSLIIPAINEFREPQNAVIAFNKFLGCIALAGLVHEAVSVYDIQRGKLLPTGYVRLLPHSMPGSSRADLHFSLRGRTSNLDQSIVLWEPQLRKATDLAVAYHKGKRAFSLITELSPTFLIEGISHIGYQAWSEALSDLWIGVEQVLSHLWSHHVLNDPAFSKATFKERNNILGDKRAWTAGVVLELLFQRAIIDLTTYENLSIARTSRNHLAHEGRPVTAGQALSALDGFLRLLSLSETPGEPSRYLDLSKQIREHQSTTKHSAAKPEVKAWREMLPLPGETKWGNKEYEKVLL